MKFERILRRTYDLQSYVDKKGVSVVHDYIKKNKNDGAIKGVIALFERIADGRVVTTSEFNHEADKDEKIFQITKGRHRFLFFYGEPKTILIFASPHLKKSQKVNKAELRKIIKIKKEYFK